MGPARGFSSILKHLAKAKLSGDRKLFNYLGGYHLSREINDEWYLSLFEDYSGSVAGEITPAYSFLHCDDLHCMAKLVPDVKLIYIIRNPFGQLLSAVHHVQKMFFLTSFKTSKAASNPESRELSQNTLSYFLSDTLSLRINHSAVLQRLFNVVDKQRVLLIDSDSVSKEPSMVASQLSQFMDNSESGLTTPSMIKRVFARR